MAFSPDEIVAATRGAAEALAPALPSEQALQPAGVGLAGEGPTADVLGPGSRAVVARLEGGLDARLVLALPAESAEALEQGPRDILDLGVVLQPWLTAATQAVGAALGTLCGLGGIEVMDPGAAFTGAPNADRVSVALMADGVPGAVLALILPPDSILRPQPVQAAPAAEQAVFTPLAGANPHSGEPHPLELLNDVELGVTAELGRTKMTVRELLSLAPGSIVELDRPAGSNLDLYVNGTLIARGEVVVIDDEFGIRISEVVGRATSGNGAGA